MKTIFSVSFLFLLSFHVKAKARTDSLISVLKVEIQKKTIYDNQKNQRINLLRKELSNVSAENYKKQYALCYQLYQEYRNFVFDSAHVYTKRLLNLSIRMHDLPKEYESKIMLGTIQLSWGMFKETFETLDQLNIKVMSDSLKMRYYELKSRAYTNQALYNTDKFYSPTNMSKSITALDSAIIYSKPGSYDRYRHMAELLNIQGKNMEAASYYHTLLQKKTLDYHQHAMVEHDLSNFTHGQEKIDLITHSAINDIKSSTKETLASYSLGSMLFNRGDIEDSELILKEALSEAEFYGNKIHKTEIVALLTTVSAQKLIDSENQKNHVLSYLIVLLAISILGTLIIAIFFYLRLQRVKERERIVKERNKHLDKINRRLLEDAHIKEEYIGYFFNAISSYILKLEKIKRNIEKKVRAKNFQDLSQIALEIDIKQERHNLFFTFDSIFLKLFPNFISAFNELLKPEDQIWPKDNEVLTTNLRIFALTRLGIKENQTIANILENTVSTIYTYKFRIKSKSIVPNEEFENKIMEINFVDINSSL